MIKCFPDLKQTFGKEDIPFILYLSSIAIEWRKNNLSELEQCVGLIYTSLYKDFTINKEYFKDYFIYTLGNEIREICNEIHRKQYK